MYNFLKILFLVVSFCLLGNIGRGQMIITDMTTPLALAQKLVGDGVTISNVTFTGNNLMGGYFKNLNLSRPALDSGIVLTSGRAKTTLSDKGIDGNGINAANSVLASNDWSLPGDANLANAIGVPLTDLNDACVLEFDFVPLGDSVKFRYSFSSEEYDPIFACSQYNDAFAFFISGPGIFGLRNIALVPGTSLPVSIANINDVIDLGVPLCPNNTSYYQDNSDNVYSNHEGLTVVLTAMERVQPCQLYHLKIVIADNADNLYDSGVFLEAKSLTSNAFQLTNLTQVDANGKSYLVEGCATGALKIRRQTATLFSQTVDLGYGGTAVNGVDVQMLPSTITIPANQTEVLLNIFPIIDNMPEGVELLKIYTLAACGIATPTDSAEIQIRDYDTLGIHPDTAVICPGGSVQLTATTGYSFYQWDANPGLSSTSVKDPIATPVSDTSVFFCTSQEGTCHGRDSAIVFLKRIRLLSKTDVNCSSASTGQIVAGPGSSAWIAPLEYAIGNNPFQPVNSFSLLPVGHYTVKIKDATGCIDSMQVDIVQAYPDLEITNTVTVNGSCTGSLDGSITVTANGGKPPYRYSVNGTTFQASNVFNVSPGNYSVTIKDVNGCTAVATGIVVQFNNTIQLIPDANPTICEGKRTTISVNTNATSITWSPASTLSNPAITNPVAFPVTTTKYYVTAKLGVCSKTDSVTVFVNPAPDAYAGEDSTICFGADIRLQGSGGVAYQWEPSDYLSNTLVSDPISVKPLTITYYLWVTDANGCKSLQRDAVRITVSKPAKLFAGNDTSVAINQPLQLNAVDINNTGFIQYTWAPAAGLNNPFIKNPVATLSDAVTMLIVTARTVNNCEGIDSIVIKTFKGPEIYVPNVFTPNGDGLNDVLKAFPVGIRSFTYFKVFNRYGEMVFYTTNENQGWNGKLKGAIQNMNSFVWMAEAIDYTGKKIFRKGTTTIVQ